ncbi:hypothetical protein [Glutamicibacter sp. X7]
MSWIEETAERMYPDSDITYGVGAVREAYAYGANEALKRLAQPVVTTVEELEALPYGTVIIATGGQRLLPEHPELFAKVSFHGRPWQTLDPSDRNDGEDTESSGTVLKWRCHGEARVLYMPEVNANA